jgi:hypothetical protein
VNMNFALLLPRIFSSTHSRTQPQEQEQRFAGLELHF